MIKNISDLKRDDMFFLLAGPCVIEGEDMALRIARRGYGSSYCGTSR